VLFLFASWFIQAPRPEDQWRTYVSLVFFVMTALMLITASVLACFSLPNDIRLQTIHTIVTKPVHKFEIVIGRILGFSLLMTVILAVMAHLSLIYVYRGIDPAFREEVFRARQSVVGDLDFQELNEAGQLIPKVKSTNIGREWEYRSYIGGGTSQQARWRFRQIPAAVYELDRVPVEFGFDIFRTTKGGDETYKEGVSLQLTFINPAKWDYSPESYTAYRRAVEAEGRSKLGESERTAKFGYYELPSPITVVDYKTYMVTFPGSILKGDPARGIPDGQELIVQVSCRTPAQYVGMARRDLYLVPADANFYTNFLKATTGVWFLTVLVIALGVVFSTYLNALVSLLLTWLLMVCGLPQLREFIGVLAQPQTVDNPGGGPAEAMFRLLKHENLTKPLEQTTGVRILTTADQGFMYFFKIFLNLLPDLGQFDRTVYLAEGFDIPGGDLLTATLMLAGYLLPFLLVGYYLLNNREVAG
jgi:ABC-type transport system involved in multi-copper enzyme maturation permease subunit